MPGKHNAGGCRCCNTFTCNDCNVITYFSLSGLSNPADCPGGCTNIHGTYVFRTVGTQTGTCRWSVPFSFQFNCGGSGEALFGQFPTGCNLAGIDNAIIEFADNGSGGVLVTVTITLQYELQDAFVTIGAGRTASVFTGSFASCSAASGQTLTLQSSTSTLCFGTDPGDFCSIAANLVITLG